MLANNLEANPSDKKVSAISTEVEDSQTSKIYKQTIFHKQMTPDHSNSTAPSHNKKQPFTALVLLSIVTLLAIALQPFFAVKPRECSRLAFNLTIYKIAEASSEYDGQCIQNSH
ncbi:MAG: hypothetical protein DCF15_01340 [Phormidesmis priestleyi]|uniref:Uncharacterized protein n=1 Tax=Phormidesmis priestleyi TaxID=268141 RepID=A0A2W4XTV3_9CYAN|nr:MAG: hypothetical protein DCF15_01340 [Phormidesmis priestleyi]